MTNARRAAVPRLAVPRLRGQWRGDCGAGSCSDCDSFDRIFLCFMLDLQRLREQIDAFQTYQTDTVDRRRLQQRRAVHAIRDVGSRWTEVRASVRRAKPQRLVADLRGDPASTASAPTRPTPVTVVATDGSQIYPDRHVDPTYFLLNIGRVAFQYGTEEAPLLDAVPDLRFRDGLDPHFDAVLASMTSEVVSALRDEMELEHLRDVARTARVDGRPLVALADGTLIRWMLRGMRNTEVENRLIQRYTTLLEDFRADGAPLASYISMPGTTEVVNLLRFDLDELDVESNWVDADTPTLRGLLDRTVFDAILAPGERSALFSSTSHILEESYPEGQAICYFYLKVPGLSPEIARVEIPEWVASDRATIDRIHAVVLDDCRKGEGYPVILSEAHERAVIRAAERESFFRLLERRLRRAGLPATGSRKRRSKQRPRV